MYPGVAELYLFFCGLDELDESQACEVKGTRGGCVSVWVKFFISYLVFSDIFFWQLPFLC